MPHQKRRQNHPTDQRAEAHRQTNAKADQQSGTKSEQAYVETDAHRIHAGKEKIFAHPLQGRGRHDRGRRDGAHGQSLYGTGRNSAVAPLMQNTNRLARGQAIGVGQVFFIDVMPAHRHGQ